MTKIPSSATFPARSIEGTRSASSATTDGEKQPSSRCSPVYLPHDAGKIELGHQVQIGYFPQNHAEVLDKKSPMTAFDWLKKRREGVYDQEIRSILGKMLFRGDDAFKPLSALSGGETARLIIGGMMLCNYNVLILDEPNNHLDLEAVSALCLGPARLQGNCAWSPAMTAT